VLLFYIHSAKKSAKEAVTKRINFLLFLFCFLLLLIPSYGTASHDSMTSQNGPIVVRIPYSTWAEKAELAGRFTLLDAPPGQGYVVAILSSGELAELQAQGIRIEIEYERTSQVQSPPGYTCYRTPAEIETALSAYQSAYPVLVQVIDIGDSWEKVRTGGVSGYDLWMVKLTNQDIPGTKPAFFLIGNIHAIEMAGAEAAMAFADWLLSGYGTNADATWLLDRHDIYIVPMGNPDGRMMAETGSYWRKNIDNDDGCTNPGLWGIDINRNFASNWGGPGSSGSTCSGTYRGPAVESEPETKAIADALRAIFPDPSDTSGSMITLHQSGHYVVWPWGNGYSQPPWNMVPPDKPGLSALADKYVSYNGYTSLMSDDWYPAAGATEDWAYEELNIAGYTFELGSSQPSSCTELLNEISLNMPAFIYAAKSVAPDPYEVTRGPDSLKVTAAPAEAPQGSTVVLNATANDTKTGWLADPDFPAIVPDRAMPVSAAEYYIDLHPTAGGTSQPMAAGDGIFDEVVEPVTANVDTTGLASGKHLLLVRAQDNKGHWGAFTGVFFTVSDTLPAVFVKSISMNYRGTYKVQGQVQIFNEAMQAITGASVTAQWTKPGGQTSVQTVTTNTGGIASFRLNSTQQGTYTLSVQNVTKSGYVYDPSLNIETSEQLQVP